ncbi:type II toxin-antitoxin system HicB family antitoxin [Marinomonas sp. RSW2]|uniref:Type II toxin-antitoxin system HicB family antitoxin n=1 Tax=Marinomonas maritima TaxID=2940935 RepID=A0ABT5WGG8_9GAMM|nr:type II toxin-antitoxin system HicB family antitoxin [Marinomonas maritima]MDE8603913.1 type II toxin-antitoxin system HicB family antitoxin [Marinomonas maritima]
MLYPVVIHKDEGSAYGVTIPDLAGCFSAGETFEEALANTHEAIDLFLSDVIQDGEALPLASSASKYLDNPDYAGGVWAVVDIDMSMYSGKTERINVTLPKYLIQQIDQRVSKMNLKSRSSYLAEAAMQSLKS